MNLRVKLILLLAIISLAIPSVSFAGDEPKPEPPPAYPVKGQVIQTLKAFDNPEGAIFSEDGKFVFVSNATELGMKDKGFHWTEKTGYISKLEVQPDGQLKMVNEKLITGLTATLGMAVSTVATKKFPKGTIFLCAGAAPIAEANGTEIKDAKRMDPKLLAFNNDGKVLGEIKMGAGTPFAKANGGAPATLPNANDFDKEGNMYVADTAVGGASFDPPVTTKPGVFMIPVTSIDDLADGKDAPVHFVSMPEGGPDGVQVGPDGMIHTNTVGVAAGMKDPAKGGMYKLTKDDFKAGKLPEPFITGLGALDGLDFAGNARLDTEIVNTSSVVVSIGNKAYTLTYDQADKKLAGPADVAIRKMADGSYLLVIPELSALAPNTNQDPVTVVKLPANFDQAK
jgi:hypothetical protein